MARVTNLDRANKLLAQAQAAGADTGRGVGPMGSYVPLTVPTKVEPVVQPEYKTSSDFVQPNTPDPLRGIPEVAVAPTPAVGTTMTPAVAPAAKRVAAAAPAAPMAGGDPATSVVGPMKPTKGIMKRGVIQPRGPLTDPVAMTAWRRQTEDRAADQQFLGGDQNSGYVAKASSNVPGTPNIDVSRQGIQVANTNEVIGAITGPRYKDSKPAYDPAGIAAAKADLARQVAFKPGSRGANYRTSAPFFNLRPRKGVEEANAVAQGAIGAINAKGGYDERIAKNTTDAARANADAARVDAGLDRASKEKIAQGANEAAVKSAEAKVLTASQKIQRGVERDIFMTTLASYQKARDAEFDPAKKQEWEVKIDALDDAYKAAVLGNPAPNPSAGGAAPDAPVTRNVIGPDGKPAVLTLVNGQWK